MSRKLLKAKLSSIQEAYQKLVKNLLTNFSVSSPKELSEEEKKVFFDTIKKQWRKEKRKLALGLIKDLKEGHVLYDVISEKEFMVRDVNPGVVTLAPKEGGEILSFSSTDFGDFYERFLDISDPSVINPDISSKKTLKSKLKIDAAKNSEEASPTVALHNLTGIITEFSSWLSDDLALAPDDIKAKGQKVFLELKDLVSSLLNIIGKDTEVAQEETEE